MSNFRRRLMMAAKESLLYTPLEYISSTGTQCIYLGIKPSINTKVDVKFKCNSAETFVFGSAHYDRRRVSTSDDCFILFLYASDTRTQIGSNYLAIPYSSLGPVINITMSKEGLYSNGTLVGTYNSLNTFYSSYNMILFGYSVAGTPTDLMIGDIYYSKVYNNNILIQDLIPCKDRQGVVCMYDKVTNQFFYNQGTGSFEAGPEIPLEYIKQGYIPLDYIQCSGSQYINTGIKSKYNLKVDTTFKYTQALNLWVFGGRTSRSLGKFGFYSHTNVMYGQFGATSYDYAFTRTHIGLKANVKLSKDGFYYNDALLKSVSESSFSTSHDIYLGTMNTAGALEPGMFIGNIYYFKLYDNDILVRDFIPCKRIDGTVCMYDLVSKTFFCNQGSGSFTAGPEF